MVVWIFTSLLLIKIYVYTANNRVTYIVDRLKEKFCKLRNKIDISRGRNNLDTP